MFGVPRPFRDRAHAGEILAANLGAYRGQPDLLVLALPRGGVPVGYEVARALDAELDVFVVRKLGVPGHKELAMGAIASGGVRVVNEEVRELLRIPQELIDRVAVAEGDELVRRERSYRAERPPAHIHGRTVFLVDDGLATGSTMRAAADAVRQRGPARLVIAVPAAARETCDALKSHVDEILCVLTPEPFNAVGQWYEDFSQTTDEEVRDLLERARTARDARWRDPSMVGRGGQP